MVVLQRNVNPICSRLGRKIMEGSKFGRVGDRVEGCCTVEGETTKEANFEIHRHNTHNCCLVFIQRLQRILFCDPFVGF